MTEERVEEEKGNWSQKHHVTTSQADNIKHAAVSGQTHWPPVRPHHSATSRPVKALATACMLPSFSLVCCGVCVVCGVSDVARGLSAVRSRRASFVSRAISAMQSTRAGLGARFLLRRDKRTTHSSQSHTTKGNRNCLTLYWLKNTMENAK
jgi:hypothetical protein